MMSGEGVLVEDIMKKNVISIESNKQIKDAASKMDEFEVGCIVITENSIPVGILTERDFVTKVCAKDKSFSRPLSEVMSSPLVSIEPDNTVWEAANIFNEKKIHKLPVASKNHLVGIITNMDLVNLCSLSSNSEMRRICDQIFLRMKN